jgi:hypothetical protein
MDTDLVNSDSSGRVVLVTEPALPATCVICTRSADGAIRFVDFNFSLDYYGAVVICEDCLKECLGLLDYTANINFTNKVDELVAKQEELDRVTDELNKYKSALDGLSFIRPDLNPLNVDSSNKSEESDDSIDSSAESESDIDGPDSSRGPENLSIFAD